MFAGHLVELLLLLELQQTHGTLDTFTCNRNTSLWENIQQVAFGVLLVVHGLDEFSCCCWILEKVPLLFSTRRCQDIKERLTG